MTESSGLIHVPPANEHGAETTASYKFWFNRIDLILGWFLRLPIFIGSLIVGWNLAQGADWYYCLLAAMMLSTGTGPALDLALSPLALLFWLCDGRYPLNQRLLRSICRLLCNAVWFSILYGTYWFLTTRHVGTYPGKMEWPASLYGVPAEKPDQTAIEKAYREALAKTAPALIATATPNPSPTPEPVWQAPPKDLDAGRVQIHTNQEAAEAGDTAAMLNLGWLCESASGQDYAQAREWYQKAANAGNVEAMTDLGRLYQNGLGVAKDYGQARDWYQKAVDSGYTDAKAELSRVQELLRAANEHTLRQHSVQPAFRRRSKLQDAAR